jgi:hypothetical protein
VQTRSERDPSRTPAPDSLLKLLRAVADAARETIDARRAADVVKDDGLGQKSIPVRNADKIAAAAKVQRSAGLHGLLHLDAGPYTAESRSLGTMFALDRMEIARGLPKHLKIDAAAVAFADVFGVAAPPLSGDAAAPIRTGTWLAYLSDVASAAGHPVPTDAHNLGNREPLAWSGVLEGFADKVRTDAARVPATPLNEVERRVVARLDTEYRNDRQAFAALSPADR